VKATRGILKSLLWAQLPLYVWFIQLFYVAIEQSAGDSPVLAGKSALYYLYMQVSVNFLLFVTLLVYIFMCHKVHKRDSTIIGSSIIVLILPFIVLAILNIIFP
jgi:hypothetical protein